MAWVALIGAGLAAASQVQQGRNDKAWAKYQAEQTQADANAEAGAAQVHASNIISMADRQRKAARAAMAASGVDVNGIGTPTIVDSQIAGDAEHDAFLTLLGGEDARKRGQQQAIGLNIKGNNAQKAGYLGAATTMLSAAGSMYSGGKVGWQGGR